MHRLFVVALLASCNEAPPKDIAERLADLPGVTVMEWTPPQGFEPRPGYRYFDLHFTQPIDHDNPSAGTFEQYVTLMHVDPERPLVAYTGGYGASWRRSLTEVGTVLQANQISVEYRFYATSRPESPDWSKLTVRQNADDEHHIYELLGEIYEGAKIQTGGSKGGENSMFHMMLYPDDVDGVVAYVAPVITDFPDLRYATVLDDVGIDACTAALRAVQRELLVRRQTMEMRAAAEADYMIAGVSHAYETAVVELEFSFWMTRGEPDCPMVPLPTATDDELYTFLTDTGGPAAYGDADLLSYGQQYLYQDHLELGYPVWQHAHLDDLLLYSYEDWSAYLPAPRPAYDPTLARELAAWLARGPDHLIFIGGEWDPWGPGYPVIASDADTLVFSVAHGSHWSSGLYSVTESERAAALAALSEWTGVSDVISPRIAPPAPMGSRGPEVYRPSRSVVGE